VVAVEATRSTKQRKATQDAGKLAQAMQRLGRQHPDKAIRGFFVTEQEPTAAQRGVVEKAGPQISAMSFATLQSRLVDARQYVSDRRKKAFGSALDPVTQHADVEGNYVALDLLELPGRERTYSVGQVLEALYSGAKVVLLGEYGVGKSMTLRQIFLDSARDLLAGRSQRFVIHINLRDHQGQIDPAEAIERHARLIGFSPNQLVRAWRSGRVPVILDGFDEISTSNWPGRVDSLQDVRRRSVALVRHFLEETPASTGLLIAGRSHFFESESEMRATLSLPPNAVLLSASDFSEEQIHEYLASRK